MFNFIKGVMVAGKKRKYMSLMEDMTNDGERVYRGILGMFNEDLASGAYMPGISRVPVNISGRGLYRIRVWSAMFIAISFGANSSQDDATEMMGVASALAGHPLEARGILKIDEIFRNFARDHCIGLISDMMAAFSAGSFEPGMIKAVHTRLINYFHDALADSFGPKNYSEQLRRMFQVKAETNTALALNKAFRLM